MPDEAPQTDGQPPSFRETNSAESSSLQSNEALLEKIRTLRLWADHLEARLAKKTEQAEAWRKRAEERKAQITELKTRPRGNALGQMKQLLSRWTPSANIRTGQVAQQSQQAAVDPSEGGKGSVNMTPVHPTIRLGVVTHDSSAMPRLLQRMNSIVISESSPESEVRTVDVLVAVGERGAKIAQTMRTCVDWIEGGNPTISIDAPIPGCPAVDSSSLNYFAENEDIFGVAPESFVSQVDQGLQPTLSAITRAPESPWLAAIEDTIAEHRPVLRERLAVGLLRQLRVQSSARAVGERLLLAARLSVPHWRPEALAALVSKRPDFVIDATNRLISQTYRPFRIAIGLHGDASYAERSVRQQLAESEIPHTVKTFSPSTPQGACMNSLVETSPGDIVMKIDDDDWYSPVFVADLVGALEFSGAAIVGKGAAFVRLQDGRFVLLRNASYRDVNHVVGPTITSHRWAWEAVRFPNRFERVDSKFLQAARAVGMKVMSQHPWDFCVIRHGQDHSWTASDNYFLSAGRQVDIDWKGIRTDGEF